MMLRENNVGSALLAGVLLDGAIAQSSASGSRNTLETGLLKDILLGNWQNKAGIARGNCTK